MASVPAGLAAALHDRYRLDRELGQGGMATVYRAHDVRHDRDVALKVLRPELAALLGRERFLNEIRLTAKLEHPHIVTLIDSGENEGLLWYVLPFIRGESLRARLTREKQLGVEEAIGITRQVAGALEYAHQHGVIHRDVKPENILLHEGVALLADFGIALAVSDARGDRLTETGLSLGTPQYMSPEQAMGGRDVDSRSDIYSLATVLYEMLAGEVPFRGPTSQAVIARVVTERPMSLRVMRDAVPAPVEAAVMKALAKVPADRFMSAAAFAAALTPSAIGGAGAPTRAPWQTRLPWILAAVATLAGAVMLARRGSTPRSAEPERLQLTTSGRAYYPVLAPDGSQLAYATKECAGVADCRWKLMIRETATSTERAIADSLLYVFPFQWSRDGLWLLFNGLPHGRPAGIYVISRLGGKPERINSGVANFLPAGDTIIAAQIAPAHGQPVWLQILPAPWSRATDSIRIAPPGGDFQPGAARVPPSGQWVAVAWTPTVSQGLGRITLQDRSGRRSDSTEAWAPQYMRWSHDAKALLLPIHLGQRNESALLRIAVNTRSGTFGRRDTLSLAAGTETGSVYDLSEDGTTLAYTVGRQGESELWTFEQESGKPVNGRQLSTSSRGMGVYISRDGRQVFLSEARPSGATMQYQWSVAPFEGGTATPLTPLSGDGIWEAVDGSRFLVATRLPDKRARITAYAVPGGAATIVSEVPNRSFQLYAARAGSMLLVGSGRDTVTLLNAQGREQWRFTLPDSVGRVGSLLPSPDGGEFAMLTIPLETPDGKDGNTRTLLVRASTATGTWRVVSENRVVDFRGYVWGDDGWLYEALATAAGPTMALYRQRPEGGAPQRVGTIPFPEDGDCELSGNARRWACARTRYLSDIYLARNFRATQ